MTGNAAIAIFSMAGYTVMRFRLPSLFADETTSRIIFISKASGQPAARTHRRGKYPAMKLDEITATRLFRVVWGLRRSGDALGSVYLKGKDERDVRRQFTKDYIEGNPIQFGNARIMVVFEIDPDGTQKPIDKWK